MNMGGFVRLITNSLENTKFLNSKTQSGSLLGDARSSQIRELIEGSILSSESGINQWLFVVSSKLQSSYHTSYLLQTLESNYTAQANHYGDLNQICPF